MLLSLFAYFFPPPPRYPDIHAVLVSFISFVQFFISYLYSIHVLYKSSDAVSTKEKVKED